MRQINNKILEIFYENPEVSFTIRQLEQLTKIPRATVHKYLQDLKKDKLIAENNVSSESYFFKIKKRQYYIEKLVKSGFVEYLIDELKPSLIILFGSMSRGDSDKESDIDIFIETVIKKNIITKKYSKKLSHPIQLFIETDINKLQPHLVNNILNGVKLYGSFKVK